jgi:hypothetical protein
MVTVDNNGRPFFGISNAEAKMNALTKMADKYQVKFNADQLKKFGGLSSFGVDIKDLPRYLDATEGRTFKFQPQKGVPNDSLKNPQLKTGFYICYKKQWSL